MLIIRDLPNVDHLKNNTRIIAELMQLCSNQDNYYQGHDVFKLPDQNPIVVGAHGFYYVKQRFKNADLYYCDLGSGDKVCIIYHPQGTFVKVFAHEWAWSQEDFETSVEDIYDSVPEFMQDFLSKSVLDIDESSYCLRTNNDVINTRTIVPVGSNDIENDSDFKETHLEVWKSSIPNSVGSIQSIIQQMCDIMLPIEMIEGILKKYNITESSKQIIRELIKTKNTNTNLHNYMNYQIHTIHGLTCILYDMPHATSVTTQLFVKAGSIYETESTNGISHFLEHMFFKGGVRYPSSQDVSRVIDEIGGEHNAYTSDDTASYYIKTAPEYVELAMDVLSDMIINSHFPADELETEQGVVCQEIKMIEDNPARRVGSLWRKRYYGDNPYGRPVIGTEANVCSFTQQMMFDHRDELYTTNNMVLVVCGKLTHITDIEAMIAKYFVGMKTGVGGIKPDRAIITRPSQHLGHYIKGTEQNHMIITTNGYRYGSAEFYAANLLGTIMGGNTSSRLRQLLREKHGLCYYAQASHSGDGEEGIFMIRAGLRKDNFDETLEMIRNELNLIATGNIISQTELDQAKGYRIGTLQMGLETSSDVAEWIGSDYLHYGHIDTIEDIIQAYRTVTREQIQQVSQQLAWDKWYTYYIE